MAAHGSTRDPSTGTLAGSSTRVLNQLLIIPPVLDPAHTIKLSMVASKDKTPESKHPVHRESGSPHLVADQNQAASSAFYRPCSTVRATRTAAFTTTCLINGAVFPCFLSHRQRACRENGLYHVWKTPLFITGLARDPNIPPSAVSKGKRAQCPGKEQEAYQAHQRTGQTSIDSQYTVWSTRGQSHAWLRWAILKLDVPAFFSAPHAGGLARP
jgi:hypothetical protein